jgi:hypothetical protein
MRKTGRGDRLLGRKGRRFGGVLRGRSERRKRGGRRLFRASYSLVWLGATDAFQRHVSRTRRRQFRANSTPIPIATDSPVEFTETVCDLTYGQSRPVASAMAAHHRISHGRKVAYLLEGAPTFLQVDPAAKCDGRFQPLGFRF